MADSKKPAPRRFIAGAVCPRCSAMDRIVVSGDGESRSCVACGYEDQRPGNEPEALPTRVSRAAARRVETPSDVVKLVEMHPNGGEDKPTQD